MVFFVGIIVVALCICFIVIPNLIDNFDYHYTHYQSRMIITNDTILIIVLGLFIVMCWYIG